MIVVLSGIEKLGLAQLGSALERTDGGREHASRTSDPRFDGPDRHPQSGGGLLVAELTPYDQQQRITIFARQPPKLTDELCAQDTILVLDQLRRGARETLQRFQAPLLGSAMIGDDVIGDTEQPRQHAGLLDATPLPPPERACEHLRGQVIACLRADPPSHISAHCDVMTLIHDCERRRLSCRTRQDFRVR